MEKTMIERTSEFMENGKYDILADVILYGKKAVMKFRKRYDGYPEIKEWNFITGDAIIDSTAKIHHDFTIFDELDIKIDTSNIIDEAKNFFDELKIKNDKEKAEVLKIKLAEEYDNDFFLNELKPELESKGYIVKASLTKQEYIDTNGRSINLIVTADKKDFTIHKDWRGWIEVRNNVIDYKYSIKKTTRSRKINKIIEALKETITSDKAMWQRIGAKNKNSKDAKQTLESILGVSVKSEKEWHSYGNGKMGSGYETEYFVEEGKSLRFSVSKATDENEETKFYVTHLGAMNAEKLKKLYDLLNQ